MVCLSILFLVKYNKLGSDRAFSNFFLFLFFVFCTLLNFKEKQKQIHLQKNHIVCIYNFIPQKRHLIDKTNIMQHSTEISNTKDSFKWQPLFTSIFFLCR